MGGRGAFAQRSARLTTAVRRSTPHRLFYRASVSTPDRMRRALSADVDRIGLYPHFVGWHVGRYRPIEQAAANFTEMQEVRGELIRGVIALDPVIDQAYGEAAELRYHSPVIQEAMEGLFATMANWRAAAVLLAQLPHEQARQQTQEVLARIPEDFGMMSRHPG